jgi:NodT family efflux transporter outer membrane factor (OMF) lipoprotein
LERDFNAYALFGSVQYELDLWGKYWNTSQSARQELKAIQSDEKAAEVVLATDVANAYFNMIRAEQLESYNQQYLQGLRELLELTNLNYQIGLEPYETVLRLQRDIAEKEKELNGFYEQKGVYAHQLSTLTGIEPKRVEQLPHKKLEQIELPLDVQMGLPLLLIKQRPDLIAQEERLKAFNIDVRIAKKNFLPTIKLSDYFGLSAQKFKNLFDGDAFFNILVGSISQSVFQGGKKIADLRLKQAIQREQVESYRQSVLTALREVEDGLVALRRSYEDQEKNQKALQSSTDSMTVANALYQTGLDSKLSLLKARNEFLNYKSTEISDRASTATAIVGLYKALGGGF